MKNQLSENWTREEIYISEAWEIAKSGYELAMLIPSKHQFCSLLATMLKLHYTPDFYGLSLYMGFGLTIEVIGMMAATLAYVGSHQAVRKILDYV